MEAIEARPNLPIFRVGRAYPPFLQSAKNLFILFTISIGGNTFSEPVVSIV